MNSNTSHAIAIQDNTVNTPTAENIIQELF